MRARCAVFNGPERNQNGETSAGLITLELAPVEMLAL